MLVFTYLGLGVLACSFQNLELSEVRIDSHQNAFAQSCIFHSISCIAHPFTFFIRCSIFRGKKKKLHLSLHCCVTAVPAWIAALSFSASFFVVVVKSYFSFYIEQSFIAFRTWEVSIIYTFLSQLRRRTRASLSKKPSKLFKPTFFFHFCRIGQQAA